MRPPNDRPLLPGAVAPAMPDEARLRYLQRLTFASGRLTASGLSGEHRSRRRGPSPEFADFKAYTPGEDFRRIDWNSYARLDHLFVKESETTTEHDIHIFVDTSGSMDWRSDDDLPTKLRFAISVTSLLGYVAIWHFDRLSLMPLSGATNAFGPVQGRSNALRMFRYCAGFPAGEGQQEDETIRRLIRGRRRPGRMLIFSDFHWATLDTLRETLGMAAARRWQTTLVLVQDPAEAAPERIFDETPHLEIEDAELRSRMHVSSGSKSIDSYLESRLAWLNELEQLNRLPGVTFLVASTDDRDASALLATMADLRVLQR
jgi:uncharacterized protein (DUF58 family)